VIPFGKRAPRAAGDDAAPANPPKIARGKDQQMAQKKKKASRAFSKTLPKAATGIQGLDEITGGGLPRGRPTLVSGGAGSGKTLFGLEFLVRGATQYSEPGVFMSFEETIPDLTKNGWHCP
jgi:predicted ATP-dependent serine protease